MEKIQEYKLKIIEIIDEIDNVKTFRLKIPEGSDLKYRCGQFFMVRFEDNETLKRAYSISSSPENKSYMEITLDLVGEFTTKLFKCKVGDYLMFKGPYGKFYFSEDMKQNLVLIGGGLGITPLRSIINFCKDKNLDNNIKLLYSSRTPEHVVYRKELEKLNEWEKFDYIQTITRPKPEDGWSGKTGRIDESMIKENVENFEDNLYFLCGPLEFVKEIISILEKLGVKKEQIKADAWG